LTAPALRLPYPESFRAPYDPKPAPEVVEEVKGMNESLKEHLRLKARKDRYFLAKGILGYSDVNPYTHGPFIRALEDKRQKRRMFLMHRGSLKSTVATVTDCVGEGLDDPNECRILIVNEIEENAIGFISEIKAHFENNDLIHTLFPELVPKRFGGPGSKWSTAKACLPRSTSYKEWTWRGVGVGSAVVSQHFTRIKCDDLIGFEARESAASMRYAISYAMAMEPLLEKSSTSIIDFIGTRWAIHDLYRKMLEIYGDEMSYFAREDIEVVPENISDEVLLEAGFEPSELDSVRGTRQPIFRRKFTLRDLKRIERIDPVLYYAQFKNNPIADGIKDFNADKLNWCDLDYAGNIVYRDVDSGQLMRWPREQLDIVMACDPNSGDLRSPDFPAIVVAAYSPMEQIFVLDAWSQRVQPDKYCETIFDKYEQWHPRIVGIEKSGMSQTAFWFKKLAKERRVTINPEPLLHKNRTKTERIRKAIIGHLNDNKLYVRKHQTTLQHQIKFHPDLDNDDELDALAYTTELFIRPMDAREHEEKEDAERKVMAGRNSITGY
jgi:hypothetical protein